MKLFVIARSGATKQSFLKNCFIVLAIMIVIVTGIFDPIGIFSVNVQAGDPTCTVKVDGKERQGTCKNSCDVGEMGTASGKGGCVKPLRCCYTQAAAGGTTCSSFENSGCISEQACNDKIKKNPRQSKASTDDCKAADGKVCCYSLPEPEAAGGAGSPTTLSNPLGAGATFYTVIQRVISAFLGMVGALALAVFVYAGVMWMTAGSSDRVQKAKDAMKYAIIGLAMIAFSYAITTFFIDTLTGRLGGQSGGAATVQYAPPPEPNQ